MRWLTSLWLIFTLCVSGLGQIPPGPGGLPKSTADRTYLQAANHARTQGLVIVSSTSNQLSGPLKTVTTAGTYDSSRIAHTNLTGKDVIEVRFLYANIAPAGSTESVPSGTLNVQTTLEEYGSTVDTQDGKRHWVTFGGSRTATIAPGSYVISDPVRDYVFTAGSTCFERVAVTVTANGTTYPRGRCCRGGTAAFGVNNGEGSTASANRVAPGAADINVNQTVYQYSSSLMLGRTVDGTITPSVALPGDSINNAVDDAAYGNYLGGWAVRLFAPSYPIAYLPISGEALYQYANPENRQVRAVIMSFATTVVNLYGRNDVEQSQTLDQFKANVLSLAKLCMSRGQTFVQSTILPAPTSTDGWLTTTNQTAASNDALRISFNQWIRDSSASGFRAQALAQVASNPVAGTAKVIDPCAPIECNSAGTLTQDGGLILGQQTSYGSTVSFTSGAGTTTTAVTSGLTVNLYKGWMLYVASGTNAGQARCVSYNSATTITVLNAFSNAMDGTSVCKLYPTLGMNGVHPGSIMATMIASSLTASAYLY